jgi:hypothetical protein
MRPLLHSAVFLVPLVLPAIVVACAPPYVESRELGSDVSAGPSHPKDPEDPAKPAAKPVTDEPAPPDAGVCAAPANVCQPAPGTPLYAFPASDDPTGATFHQPKFGGDGWLGPDATLLDGYSGVLTWPGQADVLVDDKVFVAAWLGFNLEGDFFIQNGYGGFLSDGLDQPCTGKVVTMLLKNDPTGETVIDSVWSPPGKFCEAGDRVQFKAERAGTTWIFSYRIVGQGQPAEFIEQLRHDFGVEARAQGHVMAYTEMYDYHDTVEKLHPITFGPVLVKTDSWKPVDRMTNADDFGTERLLVRPEPAIAGVTTSAAGAKCFGTTPSGAVGQVMWDSTSACWASSVSCDATTSACP